MLCISQRIECVTCLVINGRVCHRNAVTHSNSASVVSPAKFLDNGNNNNNKYTEYFCLLRR